MFHVERFDYAGPEMAPERRRLFYSGAVQGIGFRATTFRLLRGLRLSGYVRNLPDGRVELLMEGESAELDRAEGLVMEALRRNIRTVAQSTEPATGEHGDFRILR